MLKKIEKISLASAVALALAACGGGNISVNAPGGPQASPPPAPVPVSITVDFNPGSDGWPTGTADYTDGTKPTEVVFAAKPLPAPLSGNGFYLSSHNNSDDVLTYVKRQVGGFVAGAKYAVNFELHYVTDAATGCMGVGGSRGESVWMVAAASADEPKLVTDTGIGYEHLNIDRGNQAASGKQGKVLGTQGADKLSCDGGVFAAQVRSSSEAVELQADKDGKIWVMLGTDSGYESTNAVYLQGAVITAKPI